MRRSKKHKGGLVEVGALLEGALKTLGVQGDFEKFRVEKKCREVLGEKFSKALTGVTLRKRVVEMSFNHSIWMNEVQFRKSEILQQLQKEFPEIGIKSLALMLSRSPKA
ncbi:MAG TPA: DciA family protein [bacterium]|jgi:hypothetical protein|nr:DciA family protein [bacterium]